MNKVFKVIWNHATQSWVAVSELTKAHKKSTASKTDKRTSVSESLKITFLTAATLIGISCNTFAAGNLPQGIVEGTGVAAGSSSNASNNSVAAGNNTNALVNSVAIGNNTSSKVEAVAIGNQSSAQERGVSVGNNTSAEPEGVAVGNKASALPNAVAVGNGTSAEAEGIAVGNKAGASPNAVAVGNGTSTQANAVAVGNLANAQGNGVSVGNSASSFENGVAVGRGTAANTNAVAVGSGSLASESAAVAVGIGAGARAASAIAIGNSAQGRDTNTVAIGFNANSTGASAVSVGSGSLANASAVAIGLNANSTGESAVSVGSGSKALTNAVAIGSAALSGNYGTALGNYARAISTNTIALGNTSYASGAGSISMGAQSNVTGATSIAIGIQSNVSGTGAVAVGSQSSVAGGTTNGIAIGSNSTVTARSQGIAIGGASATGQGAHASGDQSIAIGGNTNSSGNSSIAIGGDDLDLVGSYVYTGNDELYDYDANGQQTATYTMNGKALRDIYNKMTGDTMNRTVYTGTRTGEGGVALGVQTLATGALSTAVGTKAKATAFGATAFGIGATAEKLNSVALGAASTTANKEGRAYATRTILGQTYTWAGGSTVDKGDIVSFGSPGYERQLVNVAPGDVSAESTDAINGSQLYSVLNSLERIRYFSVNSAREGNRNNNGATGYDAIAIGSEASASSDLAIATGYKANASGQASLAIGSETKAEARDGLAIGRFSVAAGSGNSQSIAIGAGNHEGAGANATGDQSIAIGGNTNARGNASVAIGGDDVDKSANTTTTYTNPASGAEVTGTIEEAYTNITGRAFKQITNSDGSQSTYRNTSAGESSVALGTRAVAGDIALALGTNAEASKTNSIAIGTGAVANLDNAVAIGGGATATTAESGTKQTHKSYTVDGRTYTFSWQGGENTLPGDIVSFGSTGYERQLKHVAPGEVSSTSTDAVNGSQLNAVAEKVAAGWNITAAADGGTANGISVANVQPEDNVTLKAGQNMVIDQSARDFKFSVSPTLTNITSVAGSGTIMSFGSNGITLNNRTISGVANGTAATDAVNVQQLNAVKDSPLRLNGNSGTFTRKLGETLTIKGSGSDITTNANASGSSIDIGLNKSTAVANNDARAVTSNAVYSAIQNVTLNTSGDTGTGSVNLATTRLSIKGENGLTTTANGNGITVKIDDTTKTKIDSIDNKISDNAIKLGGNTGTTNEQRLSKNGGLQFNIKGANGLTATASGDDVTVQLDTDTQNKINNAANVDLSNISTTGKGVITGLIDMENGTNTVVSNTTDATTGKKTFKVNVTTTALSVGTDDKVATPTGNDANAPVTAGSVANAINNAAWKAAASGNGAATDTPDKIKAGDTVTFDAGDNLVVTHTANKFRFATAKDVTFDKVTVGNVVVDSNGINAGSKVITNVANGVNGTDAVNKSQLDDLAGKAITFSSNSGTSAVKKLGESLAIEGDGTDIIGTSTADKITFNLNKTNTVAAGDNKVVTSGAVHSAIQNITLNTSGDSGTGSVNLATSNLSIKGADGIVTTASSNGITVGLNTTAQNQINNAADKNLSNITPAGKQVITGLVDIENGTNTVASSRTDADGKKILKVDVTTADVSVGTNGQATAPSSAPATAQSVANAINNAFWNVTSNSETADAIKAGSTVKFINGDNINITKNGTNFTINTNKDVNFDKVTVGNVVVDSNGINAGSHKITNVSAGTADTDAVNVKQLNDNLTQNVTALTEKGMNFTGNNAGTNVHRKLGETLTIKGDHDATDVSAKNIYVEADTSGSLTVKMAEKPEFKGIQLTDNGNTVNLAPTADGLNLSKDDNNTPAKLSGIANGTNTNDAVNYGQLQDLTNNVNGMGWKIAENQADKGQVKSNATVRFVDGVGTMANVTDVNNNETSVKFDVAKATLTKNATTGKLTPSDAGDAFVTANDIATAINNSGWKANAAADGGTVDGAATQSEVTNGDEVVFKAGKNLTIKKDGNNFTYSTADTVAFTTVNLGNTVLNESGLTISNGPSITTTGINAANKKITNVSNGTDPNDAVNKSQLDAVTTTVNKGWNLTAQGANATNVAAGETVDLNNTDSNIVISKTASDDNVTFNLAKEISLDKVTTGNAVLDTNGLKVGDVTVTNTAPTVNGTAVNNLNDAITQTAAQAFNPLTFGGDSGTNFTRKLGEQVNVKGGETDPTKLSDNNIGVVAGTDTLNVKLAKALKDLTSANFTSATGNTTINGDGITVTPADTAKSPVRLTTTGLDNGNNTITNVADGVNDSDAVNKGQLDKATQDLTTLGFGLKAQDGKEAKKALGNTIEVVGADDNISTEIDETDANNKKLKVKLSKDLNINTVTAGTTKLDSNGLKVGDVTVTNAPITVGGATVNNVNDAINKAAEQAFKDLTVTGNTNSDTDANGTQQKLGSTLAIEGGLTDAAKTSTTQNVRTVVTDNKVEIQIAEKPKFKEVKLADGNNAVNLTPTADGLKVSKADGTDAKISGVADGTDDGDAVNVKQLNAIKNSQLTFAGDAGTDVKRKLGETVRIKGGETDDSKLVDGNIGVIADGSDTLNVKLAKELKNLTNAQFTDGNNNTVVNGSGITITPANGGNSVSLTNNGLNNGGNKITNVAEGTDATDAVNKGQLDTAVNNLSTKGFGLKAEDGNEVKKGLGETVEVVGADNNINTKVADGKVQVELAKNLDLGDNGSVKMGDTTVNNDGLKVGDKVSVTKDGLNIGNDVKVTENGLQAGTVEINKDSGINAGNHKITNVTNGDISATSTDAVNGSQLHEVKEIAGRGWNVTTSAQAGSTGVVKGASVTQVAPGNTVTYTAGNNIMLTQNGTQITIETNQNLDAESAKIDTIKSNTIDVGGPDAQGANGKDGVVTVQSADGKAAVGINGKDGSITLTKDGKHLSMSMADGPEGVEGAVNGTKPRLQANGENVATLNDGLKFGANDGTAHAAKLNSQVNVKGHKDNADWNKFDQGKNIMTQVNGDTITVAMAKELNVDSVTAGGTRISENGLTFVDNNGKQIENSPSVTAKGIDAGNTQVTNVAPGRVARDSKDAVNGAQLHAALSDVGNKYNTLAGQVNQMGKRVNAGVASALASSQLPQAFLPGKGMVSVAAGNYQGENAIAVGVSKVSDNSKYIIRLSGTSDSQGKVGVAVGAGMHF
ncbi:YadA-like family protein [Aggregatibacter actinomycetemcomitans]|nr:YadA-like family protein [Aggregatibacter actinomycetemcomitans]